MAIPSPVDKGNREIFHFLIHQDFLATVLGLWEGDYKTGYTNSGIKEAMQFGIKKTCKEGCTASIIFVLLFVVFLFVYLFLLQ